jgi:hypothetical protein
VNILGILMGARTGPIPLNTNGQIGATSADGIVTGGVLTFKTDGTIEKHTNGTTPNTSGSTAWVSPTGVGAAANLWVRATVVAGALSTGTANVWLSGAADNSWGKNSSAGTASVQLLVEVATDSGGATIVASGTWTISYTHTGGGGGGGATGTVAMTNIEDVLGEPTGTIAFQNDGRILINGNTTQPGEWLTTSPGLVGSDIADDFEILFTYISGPNTTTGNGTTGGATKSGSTYGSWFNLGATRSISLTAFQGVSGNGSGVLRFSAQIRRAIDAVVVGSANYRIQSVINLS